jgi:hypothetical protein
MQLKSLLKTNRVLGVEVQPLSQHTTLFSRVIQMVFILTCILVVVSSFVIDATFHCTGGLSFVRYVSLVICELVLTVATVASFLVIRKYWR